MAFITKFGGFWGQLPLLSGRVFFVAPSTPYFVEGDSYEASDDNDGLSPEKAVRTIAKGVAKATRSGDVVLLLPGSHVTTATVTLNVAGVTVVGVPGNNASVNPRRNSGGHRCRSAVSTTSAAAPIFTVTAADVEIAYLHLASITAGSGISASSAAARMYVHDCTFDLGATTQTATFGITFPLGAVTADHNANSLISHCYFEAGANVGPAIRAAGTCDGLTIESSTFVLIGAAAWDDVIETTQINLGTHIADCDFFQPTSATTVMTDAIDTTGGTTDGSVQVYRCFFPTGSDAFEATATPDIVTAENYIATTTSGILVGSA